MRARTMAKSYYVKFETPSNLVSPILEAVKASAQTGKVKKGTNEVTKAIERRQSRLVIVAEDVEPPEVVAHIPILCEEQNASYVFVPSKKDLGKALGIDIVAAAAAILEPGESERIVKQVIDSISELRGGRDPQ